MSPALLDELLDALLADARSRGAERLTLAIEPIDGGQRRECAARSWRGEEVLHHRPLEWRAFDPLVRRVLISSSLDPWQFRRPQTGALAGRCQVAVEGENTERRRVTMRSFEASVAPATTVDEVLGRLHSQPIAQRPDDGDEGGDEDPPVVFVEDSPIVRAVNLILKNAIMLGAQRIVASETETQFIRNGATLTEHTHRPPAHLWPDVRRRILHMAGLSPWERNHVVSGIRIRIAGGHEYGFAVEVAEGAGPITLDLVETSEPAQAEPPPGPPPPALHPLLRGVLEAPHDLGARRVYADHLLENGDARGRFISSQLSASGHDTPPPREAADWCGALQRLGGDARFAWGFLDRLAVTKLEQPVHWDSMVSDPHWATVRALKLRGIGEDRLTRLLRDARLASLEALAIGAPLGDPAPLESVLPRLTSLCVMSSVAPPWLDTVALPKLGSLELELDEYMDPTELPLRVRSFLSLRAAHAVPDVVVAGPEPKRWLHVIELAPAVRRLSVPFFEHAAARGPFAQALVCTIRRSAPGAPISEAVLHGGVDELYRGAAEALRALQPFHTIQTVRLVSRQRALDRGREGVLRKSCATLLPRARVEVATGPCEVKLWWLAETPARDAATAVGAAPGSPR